MTALQPSETEFQTAVLELADLRDWQYVHFFDSRRSVGAGWPDLFLIHRRTGQIVVAELKKHDGRVSPTQQRWIDLFALAGIRVHVWRPEHLTGGQIARALTPSDVARTA